MRSTSWLGRLSSTTAPMLPSLCAVCRGWGRGRLCRECIERFLDEQPRCRRCSLEVPDGVTMCGACLLDPPPYESTLSAASYGFPWDRLITAFKYHGALDLAPSLAEQLVAASRRRPELTPSLLIPVPLHPIRLRERGYNQAWELARRIGRRLCCEADAALLLRIRDTPRQMALAADERAANVRGAFAVEPHRRAALRDARVTLIDDVMTTGATAAEIATVLLAAGAARVDVWVVARTPAPGLVS